MKYWSLRATGCVAAASLVLSSCASPRATYITADDPCSTFREPFVQIRERQNAEIAAWAERGAAVGAAVGSTIGAATISSGDSFGDIILKLGAGLVGGAAVGALSGAAIGYFRNLEDRQLETAALRNAVYADARSDSLSSDTLLQAVSNLNECRLTEVQRIAAAFQGGSATREQAAAGLERQRVAVTADNELIDEVVSGLRQRATIYVTALSESGDQAAETYLASIETYQPKIEDAAFTIGAQAIETTTVRSSAKLRSGPSTSDSQIGTLPAGTTVEVIRREGSWSFVSADGQQGYVANSLLGSGGAGEGGRSVRPVRVSQPERPWENEVDILARSSVELDALQGAHNDSVDRAITDTEVLLL